MSDTLSNQHDFLADIEAHRAAREAVVLPIDVIGERADQLVLGAYDAVKQNGGKVLVTGLALTAFMQGPSFSEHGAAPDNRTPNHLAVNGPDVVHSPVSIVGMPATKIVVAEGESVRSIATEASQKTHIPEAKIEQDIKQVNHLTNGQLTTGEVIEAPSVVAPAPESTINTPSSNESVKKPTIYYIGDSITVGDLQAGLLQDLSNNGWSVDKAEANVGDNVGEGIQRLEADSAQVTAATHVVIELGTNNQILGVSNPTADSEVEFQGQIQDMIGSIKKINPTAEISMLTVHDATTDVDSGINQAIRSLQSQLGYNVIDWDGFAKAHPELNFDHDMGVHLDPAGYALMSQFIANSIGKAPVPAPAPTTTTTTEAPVPTTQPPKNTQVLPEMQGNPETNDTSLAIEQIVGYIHDKYGMPINGIAAMAGNMQSESFPGPNSERLEGYYHQQVPIESLTQAQIDNVSGQESGYGIVQFTPLRKYIDWGEANNIPLVELNSIYNQLDFVMYQLKTEPEYQELYNVLMNPNLDPAYGAEMFMKYYERPLGSTTIPFTGPAAESLPTRQAQAVAVYVKFNPILNPPAPAPTTTTTVAPTTTTVTSSVATHSSANSSKKNRPTGRVSRPTGKPAHRIRPTGRTTKVSGVPRDAGSNTRRHSPNSRSSSS